MSQQIYMNYIHPSSLLKQLSVLWRTDQLCDAVVTVDKVIIAKAHKLVLFAISPKLKRDHSSSQQSSILEVDLPSGICSSSAEAFLQYMYEGFLVLTEPLVRDLSRIAKHLDIQCLIRCCNDFQSKLDSGTLHTIDTDYDDEAINNSADFPHVRRFCVKNKIQNVNSSGVGPQAKRSRITAPNVKETLDIRNKQGNSTPVSEGQVKQNAFPQFVVKTTQRAKSNNSSSDWTIEPANVGETSNTDTSVCKKETVEISTCSYDSNVKQSQSTEHTSFSHSSTPSLTKANTQNFEGSESTILQTIKTEPEDIDSECEMMGVSMSDASFSYAQDTHSDYTQSDLDQSNRGNNMMRFDITAASASDLNESYTDEHAMNITNSQPGLSRMNEAKRTVFTCRWCGRDFKNRSTMKRHSLVHNTFKAFICKICEKQFRRQDKLKDHLRTCHSILTHNQCTICDTSFQDINQLRYHMKGCQKQIYSDEPEVFSVFYKEPDVFKKSENAN